MDTTVLFGFCVILFILLIIFSVYFYNAIQMLGAFSLELSDLVSRTFREYYKNEDIEPVVINNGIDIVWKGDVKGTRNEDNKMGFITVFTNDGNINSPLNTHKEADIVAGKIIHVVNEFVKERDSEIKWWNI